MTSQSEVYLTKIGDELLLNYGTNARRSVPPAKRVLVLGGNVVGLTTAWALLDAGYDVIVISEGWPPFDRSYENEALWEWSPVVCGKQSQRWCSTTRRALEKLAAVLPVEEHGVRKRTTSCFFGLLAESIPDRLEETRKHATVHDRDAHSFGHDLNMVEMDPMNSTSVTFDTITGHPVVNTDHYTAWLRHIVTAKNGHFITARVDGDLLEQESRLLTKYGADAIVNASGIGAYEAIVNKTAFPLRSRMTHDGAGFLKVEEALYVSHGEEESTVFFMSGNEKSLGLEARPETHALSLAPDLPATQIMRQRYNSFVPACPTSADVDVGSPSYDLQPFRDANFRVEREERLRPDGKPSCIIHSYGKESSGLALSYGCAADVVRCVEELEAGLPWYRKASHVCARL